MKIIQSFMTKNRCYTNAKIIKVTKLVLHSLGVAQPNANVLINNWDNQTASVCVHAFVMDNQIIQTLPWDYKAWHVGSGKNGSYNNCSIGIEICEPFGHKYNGGTMVGYDIKANADYFIKVYNNAVELFTLLCKEFGLDPLKDIVCHSEVNKLGYGTNHADVMHWFPKHGKSMDDFRKDVQAKMNEEYIPNPVTPESSNEDIKWVQEHLNKVVENGTFVPLSIDGDYGNKTRITVLTYWEQLGWNKDGQDTGWKAGKSTIKALKEYRMK